VVVHYIKPMQCGGSDQGTVEATIRKLLLQAATRSKEESPAAAAAAASRFHAHTLFRWETPTSPHIASRLEGSPLSDNDLMNRLQSTLASIEKEHCDDASNNTNRTTTTYIETAGGVMSPSSSSPDNTSLRHAMGHQPMQQSEASNSSSTRAWGWLPQADLYQPLLGLAPVVLVGDGRLGGISATLSSLESLLLRGYDVAAIVLLESHAGFDNAAALREYATRRLPIYSGTGEHSMLSSMPRQSIVSLPAVPADINIPLDDWYASARVVETFGKLNDFLHQSWQGQVADLASLQSAASKVLWGLPSSTPSSPQPRDDNDIGSNADDNSVLFMDGASGSELYFMEQGRIKDNKNTTASRPERRTILDHTRHNIGHGDSNLTLANAAALSRYGGRSHHFEDSGSSPSSYTNKKLLAHAPAIALSQKLLHSTSSGQSSTWAHRVLFHNDKDPSSSWPCSTAIEMGLKTFQRRLASFHENNEDNNSQTGGDNAVDFDAIEFVVCGQFNGSTYHHCRELEEDADDDSTVPGLFLETPHISFQNGRSLSIQFPQGFDPAQGTTGIEFDSIAQALDVDARVLSRKLYSQYKELIEMQWLVYEHSHCFRSKIGSVVLEPIVLMNSGTGTLELVDPLWQRALMDIAKSRNVPVVWNESSPLTASSTADLYQVMGPSSSGKILKSNPDIACYTLHHLVGGVVDPVHATLASKEIFETVMRVGGIDDEEDIDLYHSIPHPVRCVNALYALEAQEAMMSLAQTDEKNNSNNKMSSSGLPRIIFDEKQIRTLSELPLVERSFAFGTLCAVTMAVRESVAEMQKDSDDTDEASSFSLAVSIVQNLRLQGIPARSLGKTVYVIVSPTTDQQECTRLLNVVHQTIKRHVPSL
jgi:bifunctional dethiobiotin synthetase / adenosylmethionine---8-amino-7-oxononanoate aminotransferase